MGWIFVDKESEGSEMRQQMRRNMRGGGHSTTTMRGDEFERGYRMGYKHGWEDSDDEGAEYRRGRDSRGRYV